MHKRILKKIAQNMKQQLFSTLIIISLEQQIIILEGFLKDHVTPKTGVMMLKIHRNEFHFENILLYL